MQKRGRRKTKKEYYLTRVALLRVTRRNEKKVTRMNVIYEGEPLTKGS